MAGLVHVPALRSLFADSCTFSNAFSTSPLCAPARAALLTGRYTYILSNGERAHDGHETILRPSDAIFPEYLKAAGYVTKHTGKGHLGAQKFFDAFDENADGWDRWDPPVTIDEAYLAHLARLGVKPQRYQREIRGLQQDRRTPGNSFGGWIEQADGRPFPFEAQYSAFLADRTIRKLDAALARGDGRAPVYVQLDFFDPHQPFSIPAGFEAREKELRAAMRLPRSYEEVRARDFKPFENQPKIYGLYRKYWGLYDSKTVEDYRVANALQVEVVDRAISKFISELKRRGLYDESLIVFTADHGEMNGRQALVDKGVYLYPETLRVPLAVKMPKSVGVTSRTVDSPVSHLDIAPTLLEAAGVRPAERLDGESLLPLMEGQAGRLHRELLVECGWHVGVNFACGFQQRSPDGHFLYTYNASSDVDEFYDLAQEDPANLVASSQHATARSQAVAALGGFLERDARWLGWWSSFRLDHYGELPSAAGDLQLKDAPRE
jgi:arylsulfatase A-like enzyme